MSVGDFKNIGELSEFLQDYIKVINCDETCQAKVELAKSDPATALKDSWPIIDRYMGAISNGNVEGRESEKEVHNVIQTVAEVLKNTRGKSQIKMPVIADVQCPPPDTEEGAICEKVKTYQATTEPVHALQLRDEFVPGPFNNEDGMYCSV